MAKFQSTQEVTLTSSTTGVVSVVVVPQAMYSSNGNVSGQDHYPYICTNNINPLRPYHNSGTTAGPFLSQDALISLRAPDICNLRFINTMNSLTSSGKLISSIFY